MRFVFLFGLLFFANYNGSSGWRIFHNGRSLGGNLGEPHHNDLKLLKNDIVIDFERWFEQDLDHFNPTDERKWQQRYFVNEEFFDKNARDVVFLQIGGEGEASDKWMTQGAWINYAKQYNALCFQLEHRFYGKSHPTPDLSVKNLQYLTSQQALADLAVFIEHMNVKYELSPNVKWIAFGGSYPGSLAAWLRQKYPHLVQGAMSASGPLLAQLDFKDYFRVINEDLKTTSEACFTAVQQGTEQINTLLKHMVGQRNLNNLFHLCDPLEKTINNPLDMSNFFETLSGNWANIAQYNKDNRMGKNPVANITLDTLCNIMTNQTIGPQVHRLAVVNELLMHAYDQKCIDYKYDKMIESLRNDSWDSEMAEGGRQWTYQTCTEFAFFQSSAYKPQVFGDKFPVSFFVQQCMDIFGPKFNQSYIESAIERTNTLYGALDIQVDNVVFVHGSVDPWHALGIIDSKLPKSPSIYIKGTAHCANMYPPKDDDLPGLKAARKEILKLIGTWLKQ